MDAADLTARLALLSTPLLKLLEQRWPLLRVQLDTAEAAQRPGAPIGVRWTDGPSVAEVRGVLVPRFADDTDGDTGAYPISLARFYSPTALAATLLRLHADGQLSMILSDGRAAFWAAVDRELAGLPLPEAIGRRRWQRAALLAELAGAVVGGDAFTWAVWLGDAGWERVNPSLDAVFGKEAPPSGPDGPGHAPTS